MIPVGLYPAFGILTSQYHRHPDMDTSQFFVCVPCDYCKHRAINAVSLLYRYNPASIVVWLSFGCIRYLSPTFDRFPSELLKCSHSKYQLHGITHRRRYHEFFHISLWLAVSKRQLTIGALIASWLNPHIIGKTDTLPSLFGSRTAATLVGRISRGIMRDSTSDRRAN